MGRMALGLFMAGSAIQMACSVAPNIESTSERTTSWQLPQPLRSQCLFSAATPPPKPIKAAPARIRQTSSQRHPARSTFFDHLTCRYQAAAARLSTPSSVAQVSAFTAAIVPIKLPTPALAPGASAARITRPASGRRLPRPVPSHGGDLENHSELPYAA